MPEADDQRQILSAFQRLKNDSKNDSSLLMNWSGIQMMPALSHDEQTLDGLLFAELRTLKAMHSAAGSFQISGTQILNQQGTPVIFQKHTYDI